MKKQVEVQVPLTPNFIKVGGVPYPIRDFEEHELAHIGELWTKALIEKARKRRVLH